MGGREIEGAGLSTLPDAAPDPARRAPVVLAGTPAFRIGPLSVDPGTRKVFNEGELQESLEPRVMEVLVALHRARGDTLSREDLSAACWRGTVVGEDALQRVIQRLRKLGAVSGAFRIETITRVGYRLLPAERPPAPDPIAAPRPRAFVRRAWPALVALLALVALAVGVRRWAAAPPSPMVVLRPFTAASPGERAVAADLQHEILAGLSRDSLVAARVADDDGGREVFTLSGRIGRAASTRRIELTLTAPVGTTPLLTRSVDAPAGQPARDAAWRVVRALRCVVTASETSAARPTLLAPAALVPWARYCAGDALDGASPAVLVATLEQVVGAEPGFANGWGALAQARAMDAVTAGGARPGGFAAATAAADRALALDRRTASAWVLKSWIALGILGAPDSPTHRPRFTDFARWDRYSRLALARPGDCGCEVGQRGFALEQMGQDLDALASYTRASELDPAGLQPQYGAANVLAKLGRLGEARQMLDALGPQRLGLAAYDEQRFAIALWSRDWADAARAAARMELSPLSAPRAALVNALASGDRAALAQVRARLATLAAAPATLSRETARLLAIAGGLDEAIAAADRLLDRPPNNLEGLHLLYEPGFAAARARPAFAALGRKLGLLEHWRAQADFCRAADAPAFCRPDRAQSSG